jgi:hypothetical protein
MRLLLARGAASTATLAVCRSCHAARLGCPVHWPIPAVLLCAVGTKPAVPRLGCCSRVHLARRAVLLKSMRHPVGHPRGSHFSMWQTTGLTCHPAPTPKDVICQPPMKSTTEQPRHVLALAAADLTSGSDAGVSGRRFCRRQEPQPTLRAALCSVSLALGHLKRGPEPCAPMPAVRVLSSMDRVASPKPPRGPAGVVTSSDCMREDS